MMRCGKRQRGNPEEARGEEREAIKKRKIAKGKRLFLRLILGRRLQGNIFVAIDRGKEGDESSSGGRIQIS